MLSSSNDIVYVYMNLWVLAKMRRFYGWHRKNIVLDQGYIFYGFRLLLWSLVRTLLRCLIRRQEENFKTSIALGTCGVVDNLTLDSPRGKGDVLAAVNGEEEVAAVRLLWCLRRWCMTVCEDEFWENEEENEGEVTTCFERYYNATRPTS
ncbi:hypothetical protein Peur_048660 [Populus x canadensis]